MNDEIEKNVFEKICEPLQPLLNETVRSLPVDSQKYKLSFGAFAINLIYGIVCRAKSIAGLTVEIETSPAARELELVVASRSMYSESFRRYRPDLFRRIFANLLASRNFLEIPEIRSLGRILLIDGSLFPAVSTMAWAKYKEGANALKMHLSFELNRMIPVHFLCAEGNYSEKAFLRDIVEKGATYVCDRGYVSFETFKRIGEAEAFFVIRSKCNLLYDTIESMAVEIPECFSKFFDDIEDTIVAFRNDSAQISYRIVKFASLGESYVLTTNRYDLNTYQIIMLYAYRWQIELYFRFFKRTLNGIHLWCMEPRGIEIQFYVFMIAHILILEFKQECRLAADAGSGKPLEKEDKTAFTETSRENADDGRFYVCGLVSLLGDKLKKNWKIGIHWLIALKNILTEKMDSNVILFLEKYA
jgi:hypothetical protein